MKKIIILLILLNSTYLSGGQISNEAISSSIRIAADTKLSGRNKNIVKMLYDSNGYAPIWVGSQNKHRQSELIKALNNPLYNYKNKPMGSKSIKKLFFLIDNNEIKPSKKVEVYARLDILLSNSFVSLVRFIVEGDVDWNLLKRKMKALKASDDIEAKWEITPKSMPSVNSIIQGISSNKINAYLSSLIPMRDRYIKLVAMLKDYRIMSKLPKIVYTNTIFKIGDRDKKIIEIKKHLQISGDYPKTAPINKNFDAELERAVITYQKRYNLKVDGKVDKVMTYYLNLPVKKNIQQIIANLDKCKLYPRRFENEYIEVNIPDFNLRYYRDGVRIFKTGIVVGRIDRPTPIFSDKMTYMVLNPTWTVPDNLIKRDLIHVLRENPNYLKENNIRVFSGKKEVEVTSADLDQYEHSKRHVPYRFVQYPGDTNALGRVKFMFPNKYAVYLHDTDNKSLLERRYKIYSSGCMRVDKPFDLLNILLRHAKGNYTQARIQQILDTLKPTTIKLTKSIPVHILYFTVYKEDGLAYFKNDIYLYDQMIWESSTGHKKATFKIPDRRFIDVDKNGKKSQKSNTKKSTRKRSQIGSQKNEKHKESESMELF